MHLPYESQTARKDYDDRRTRQKQGVKAAQARGAYKGRSANTARNDAIMKMLQQEASWLDITKATGCSRMTVARLARRLRGEAG